MSFIRLHPGASHLGKLICLLAAVGLLLSAGTATAAKKKKKREKSYVLTLPTAQKMMKVLEKAEEEDWDGALAILKGLAKKRKLKPHDKAVVYQNIGMMYAAKEDYASATPAFETALAQDALPASTALMLQYNLAQLYMANEEYAKATDLLEKWFAAAENPNDQANFLLAAAYAVQERWAEGLPYARTAVTKAKVPTERYLSLQLALEFQNGNLLETFEVLKVLATHFPRKRYFIQLAGAYSEMGEEKSALAMMELAYQAGWLSKENELSQLAQRYYAQDLPIRAAEVMGKAFEDGLLEETDRNYEFYANSLLNAREYEKALGPLEKAAELSDDGELFIRLAQVYLEVANWPEARKAINKALAKGDLKDTANAHLLLGIVHLNEKHFDSAQSSFEVALKSETTRFSAQQWLEHVDRQRAIQ
jgi:tetratricopeptide (TPR) repeat protein